jgi:hypothetical protein
MAPQPPQLLYQARTRRGSLLRGLIFSLIVAAAAGGLLFALSATAQGEIDTETANQLDPLLVDIGQIAAAVVIGAMFVRAMLTLYRMLTRRSEWVRVYNQGITWERKGEEYKYSWNKVRTYIQGARILAFLGIPLIRRGRMTLIMGDGVVYDFKRRLGDPAKFNAAVEPYIAEITGTRIGQALREKKAVRLHKNLVVASGGLVIGDERISWKVADVVLKGGHLHIGRVRGKNKIQTVKRIPIAQIENLAGFMDVAESVIQNNQPQRFNIKAIM